MNISSDVVSMLTDTARDYKRDQLEDLGFDSIFYNCFFSKEPFHCCLFFNGNMVWFQGDNEIVTLEDVIENCEDNLRDVILFNLDLFV